MNLDFGYSSDPGLVKQINEDSIGIVELTTNYQSSLTNIKLFAIADGMGGHEAGEIASRLAISSFSYWLTSALLRPQINGCKEVTSNEYFIRLLNEGVLFTNEKFGKRMAEDKLDLGSTLLMLLLVNESIFILNIDDCRAYLLDKNAKIRLLTTDHSLAFRYYLDQQISYHGIVRNPDRNKLFCSFGDPYLLDKLKEFNRMYQKSNVSRFCCQTSQIILLCSDGIWESLSEPVIQETLVEYPIPTVASRKLVEMAKEADGQDNSSAIVIHIK